MSAKFEIFFRADFKMVKETMVIGGRRDAATTNTVLPKPASGNSWTDESKDKSNDMTTSTLFTDNGVLQHKMILHKLILLFHFRH